MSRSIIQRTTGIGKQSPQVDLLPGGSIVLPAANAFTNIGPTLMGNGENELALWVTYLSASATGQLAIRPLFDFKNNNPPQYNETILDPAVAAAQPFGNRLFYLETLKGPIPGSGLVAQFVLRLPIPQGAVTVGFAVADLGTAPGSLVNCSLTFGSNGSGLAS